MAEPFLSEIRLFSFGFPPKGWAFCNGALMPINQNQPLFSLLGTTFGGDGRVNFALPNLQGKVPVHVGSGFTLGQTGGEPAHTLSIQEFPTHAHLAFGSNTNAEAGALPPGNLPAIAANLYGPPASLTTLTPGTVGNVGGSQPHLNMQPFLSLNFCIALQGIFPSPN
jgi:microcystin-dependent protein